MRIVRVTDLQTMKIAERVWRLSNQLIFIVGDKVVRVPRNFVTDGASCPRFLWALCPPMAGTHSEAAVLHDFLYSKDCKLPYTRKQSDQIFLAAMRANGTGLVVSALIYSGVRMGGWTSYKKQFSEEKLK